MFIHRRILLLTSETNDPDLYEYSSSPPLPAAVPFQRHLSNAAIAAVSASASIFLALTFYSVLRCRRRRRLLLPNPSDESYSSAGDESSDGGGGGWAHHVWNIRTVGLDNSAILSIGSHAYLPPSATDDGGSPAAAAAAADCSVCLGEVEDGDMVRLLPKCGHVFHVSCIDTWLRAHVSCPLCRAHILPSAAAEGAADGEARVRVVSDTEAPPSPPPGSPARLGYHVSCMPIAKFFSLEGGVKYGQSFTYKPNYFSKYFM